MWAFVCLFIVCNWGLLCEQLSLITRMAPDKVSREHRITPSRQIIALDYYCQLFFLTAPRSCWIFICWRTGNTKLLQLVWSQHLRACVCVGLYPLNFSVNSCNWKLFFVIKENFLYIHFFYNEKRGKSFPRILAPFISLLYFNGLVTVVGKPLVFYLNDSHLHFSWPPESCTCWICASCTPLSTKLMTISSVGLMSWTQVQYHLFMWQTHSSPPTPRLAWHKWILLQV